MPDYALGRLPPSAYANAAVGMCQKNQPWLLPSLVRFGDKSTMDLPHQRFSPNKRAGPDNYTLI